MVTIHLTKQEMLTAIKVGVMRQIQNIEKGVNGRYGADKAGSDWQFSIEGALGEFAVAKYRRIPWDGNLGNYKAADVGRYQVRTAITHHNLILHPADKDGDVFVSVYGANGDYLLCGWMRAQEGKQTRYWGDPFNKGRPAFFVPQTELNPIETLPELKGV